jgi:thioester reductase-like protein
MADRTRTILLTGFPASFLARRLLATILAREPDAKVVCLVPRRFGDRAAELLDRLAADELRRVELLRGDSAAMDFGLAGQRYRRLAASIDVIHHCAAVTYPGVARDLAERVNVGGTGEVLELVDAADRLQRLVLWSTAQVSGTRTGRVEEGELVAPGRFHNVVEETRFRAEAMVREAMERVPTVILRPSHVVGDSSTGEIDRLEGPYLLILLMLSTPVDLRVPLPGRGDAPLNLVPIDYVVAAGHAIANDARAVGRTFHLVDERPPTARRVFELIAQATGRPGPRGRVPTQLAAALLRAPGLERLSQVPRAFLEQLATDVVYDARNAHELLAGTGIACPPAASYLPVMVEHVKREQERRARRRQEKRRAHDEADDPLG